ncbi:rCG20551, isoform CRA_a [Rattus norvegicus]|uniref:Mitochondrial import inner membrane translocase subunit Tim21 n=1 Tax=Rattus norvegicus TaxID=10116 RepID=A6K5M5_RAT|nr:rCG20551, isoform CRA_a [Rattus norvegicus]
MICAFLRVVRHAEKLHGSLGRQLLLPHFVLTKACLKTQPLRWGLREQKKTVQPRTVLGFTQKTFWTQGPDPRKAKEDSSKQVSINRNQREETGVSTSQKVKEAGRDVTYLIVVLFGVSITGYRPSKHLNTFPQPLTLLLRFTAFSLCFFRQLVIYDLQRTVFLIQS